MTDFGTLLLAGAVLCMVLAAARINAPIDLQAAAWAFALGWLLVTHLP
jgi:hypothetical protein